MHASPAAVPTYRAGAASDLPFLSEMLYEAAYWRPAPWPSVAAGLAHPDIAKLLQDWGERHGDTAVVACLGATPVGAAWYRFWSTADHSYGFVDEATPEIAIAVRRDARGRGIAAGLLSALIGRPEQAAIATLSLSVAKENHAARRLYLRAGFADVATDRCAWTMVWSRAGQVTKD